MTMIKKIRRSALRCKYEGLKKNNQILAQTLTHSHTINHLTENEREKERSGEEN